MCQACSLPLLVEWAAREHDSDILKVARETVCLSGAAAAVTNKISVYLVSTEPRPSIQEKKVKYYNKKYTHIRANVDADALR